MNDHTTSDEHAHLHLIVRDVSIRAVAAIGLAGIGLIHLLDSIGKYGETRYIFWMYVGLMVASLAVGGALLFSRGRAIWLAALALAVSAIAGFVLSRTVGLPNATDDIGNWTEPLGLAALFVEGSVVAISVAGLAHGARLKALVTPARSHPVMRGREQVSAAG